MSEKSVEANFDENSGNFLLQLRPDDVGLANKLTWPASLIFTSD